VSRLTFACVATAAVLLLASAFARAQSMVVHEWGTFTSLQDESGNAIGGINADDEPVPPFVHDLGSHGLVVNARADRDIMSMMLSKGIPSSHPDVTMRLETPVIYFHLPKDAKPTTADVSVTFRGGWLTQYYPWAAADVDGRRQDRWGYNFRAGRIVVGTESTLTWDKLTVGANGEGPKTNEKVWLAPRAVPAAANVTIQEQPGIPATGKRSAIAPVTAESERFLFYRGVGHMDSPLRVRRDGGTLHIDPGPVEGPAWLVEIRADGTCAFRTIDLSAKRPTTPSTFADTDYKSDTKALRAAMRAALVSDGLYDDEADAMLNTWEESYFKNAGTRVFFMVPRKWTDAVLPLTIKTEGESVPSGRMVRTMVGRVELVTPQQRELLKFVANPPGKHAQLGAYRDLGRFRDALVISENLRKPTTSLAKLMQEQLIHQPNLSKQQEPDVSSGG
jgi:hypothetical protein